MTHRTRPARTPHVLGLAALSLALLHACAFAPRLRAWQSPIRPPLAPAAPAADERAVKKEWLLYALRSRQHDEAALMRLVERRGSSFVPTAEDEKELRAAGATDRLLEAVHKHYRQPEKPGPGIGGGMAERSGFGPRRGTPPSGEGGPGDRGPVDYTRPFRQNEVTRRAMITFKPQPGYTDEAQKNRVQGVVRLRAVLAASGEVTNASVVKGLPDGLTEKAIAAAREIRFTPAEKDGRIVSQHVTLEYIFDAPLNEGEVDEPAIILEKPEADYTEEARRNNVRGQVVLKVTLTSFNNVAVDSVEVGLPHGLTEKAVEAARRIKFEPAWLGRGQVSQRATVEYTFAP
ncbi:MAG: TonB family protein [Pyrinomonadaceae bacterium]